MHRWLGKHSELTYTALRVVAGLDFAQHGAQKLAGMFGGSPVRLFSEMGVAGVIELVGGLFIAFGLFASWAAFVASGEMAVAFLTVHLPRGIWPIMDRGDLAIVFCFLFLFIGSRGSGRWSLDRLLRVP
jgi:putative oxidoreductase